MSIIQKIREKAAWIVIGAIAVALIAFVVQDAFRSNNLFSSNPTNVGNINGLKVSAVEFETRVNQAEEQYRNAGYPVNDVLRENIRASLWNEYLEDGVFSEHYDNLGIRVYDNEINDILFGNNPPQDLRRQFTDPNTGLYDANAAAQQIQALKKQKNSPMYNNFFNQYIPALAKNRQKEKYISLISNSAYVPKWLVEKMAIDNSQVASISYVNVPYTTISDSAVKVTDQEIQAYVDNHKEEYKQEEARGIEYVMFDAAPSKEDSAEIYKQITSLKNEFLTTTDAASFVVRNGSETSFYDGYVQKSKLQVPNSDSITSLQDGQVYGPYIDGGNYVMAKMVARRNMPDSVKVRHILIKTGEQGRPLLPDSIAKKRIDSIATAIRNGAKFDSMVVKYSDDQGSVDKGGVYDFASSQFGSISKEFAETAFYGKAGDKKVVKVDNASYSGYHYIEVLNQKNFEPAYKVAYLSKAIVASDQTINHAMGLASQFAGDARNQKDFEANAKKQNINTFNAVDIKPLESAITGLGSSREMVRWVFGAEKGEVADRPFLVGDKYVVPVLTAAYEDGTMPVELARQMVKPIIMNDKKAAMIVPKFSKATTLDAVAKATGQSVAKADSIQFSSQFIPNVGMELKVIGAAFNKANLNKPSSPISGSAGVFVIQTDNVTANANPNFDVKAQQESLQQYEQRALSDPRLILDILKKGVKIKDNRLKFF